MRYIFVGRLLSHVWRQCTKPVLRVYVYLEDRPAVVILDGGFRICQSNVGNVQPGLMARQWSGA